MPRWSLLLVALMLAPLGGAEADTFSPRCFLTGSGAIDGETGTETFAGNASSRKDGTIVGSWTHTTDDGRTLQGNIDLLLCRRDGGDPGHPAVDFSIADFSGTGIFDGQAVAFTARAQDRGEPGRDDVYHLGIEDMTGTVLHATGAILTGGNIQIHPINRGHP